MFLGVIDRVDNLPYTTETPVWRFVSHDGYALGKMTEPVVRHLEETPVSWLQVDRTNKTVRIADPESLDDKFAKLTATWRAGKVFECLAGWRNELYSCYTAGGSKYFAIERSAAALFGLVTYGCHITGYCPDTKQIWVPRRAQTKQTYPGMLDNTVAGGLGDDLGFKDCAIKECGEEAGLPPSYVLSRLHPAGVVSYEFVDPETGYFQPEVECVYDLVMEHPSNGGLAPRPVDGEAEDFQLMTYAEVKKRMLAGEFKYNCGLVLVDFFVRHGEISAENEPDYFEIVSRCHRKLEYPLRRGN